MKKIFICLLGVIFILSLTFIGVGCKEEAVEEAAPAEEAVEEAAPAEEELAGQKITVIMPRHEMDLIGIWEQQTREFEEETGIEVELIQTEWEKAADKIQVEMAAGGSTYDVIEFDNSWVAKFVAADWVVPLDDYMPAGMKEELLPGLVSAFSSGGKLLGVAWNNDTRFFMYNSAMLEEAGIQEPPHTFAELVEQTETIKEKGIANYGWADFWPQSQALANSHAYFLYSFGGDFFDDEGNPIFNNDAGIEALQFMVDAINDKVVDPASLTYEQEDAANIFYKGDTPFFLQAWPGVYAFSNDEEQSNIVGQVKVAEWIPAKSEDLQATLTLPEAFSISKFSENKDAAWEFIEFMTSKEKDKERALSIGSLPLWSELYNDTELLEKYPYWEQFGKQILYAKGHAQITWYDEFSYILQVEVQNALIGQKTAEEALNSILEQIQDKL